MREATALGGEMQHAMERLRAVVEESGGSRSTTAAMANLAEAIQGLVAHMRTEQQMIREWADGQGEQNREIKKLLERIARQPEKSCGRLRRVKDEVTRPGRTAARKRCAAEPGPICKQVPALRSSVRTPHRVRDTIAETIKWPSPVHAATIPVSTTGRVSSTRCRRWCCRSCSCCRCFWWCSSSCRRKSPARTRRWSSSTPRSRS